MNDDLRNSLWNLFFEEFTGIWQHATRSLFKNYFKESLDKVPRTTAACREFLSCEFAFFEWFEVYNFVEHCLLDFWELSDRNTYASDIEEQLNFILERELSGYRAIKGEIVPITDKQEVESIREAFSEASSGLEGVSTQIKNALHLLGKKPEPDYRNSIKESISAVEGICKLLTGERSGGLDNAMKKLSKKIHLHPSLKLGFLKLYGYTSDEDGIRHSILEEKEIGFAEAKYMLVTCSAFVNFVRDKAHKEGML
jgi:hypothetical protein